MLPEEAIIEFKQIYKEETGLELSDEEAVKKANGLISLFDLFSKPKSSTNLRSVRKDTVEI